MRLRTDSSAAAGLHAVAAEEDTQLVVVGSSQRSGLDRVLPGSTANRLLSGSPVAVAIAPVGYADRQPDEGAVACGYDGSPAAREALKWAAEFARRGRRPLRVLAVQRQLAFGHVGATGAFGAKSANDELRAGLAEDLEQAVADLPIESVESEILEGDPVHRLVEGSAGVALLVLGSRGYGPMRTVLLGSVAAGVVGRLPVRCSSCPAASSPPISDERVAQPSEILGHVMRRRPVMCAVEEGEAARHAVRAAAWLARAFDTELVLAHAFDPMGIPVRPREEMLARGITDDDLADVARRARHACCSTTRPGV